MSPDQYASATTIVLLRTVTTAFANLRSPLAVAIVVASVSCGGSPTTPSAPLLTGTWTGPGFFTAGTLTLHLTQSGSSLTGPWTEIQVIDGVNYGGPSGTVSGTVSGSSVSMTFLLGEETPDCTFPISATATVSANQMIGTYSSVNVSCSIKSPGRISLTKQ